MIFGYLPVDGEVIGGLVEDVNDKGVALMDADGWARKASVHRGDHLPVAQLMHRQVLHLQEKFNN